MTDEKLLSDAVGSLLSDRCTMATVRSAEQEGHAPALWASLRDSGFTRVSLPESVGGSGGSLADERIVLDLAARYAAPVPLAEDGLLGSWALAGSGLSVPDGIVTVAVGGHRDVVRVDQRNGVWRLSADLRRVPYAEFAERIVMFANTPAGGVVVSAPAADGKVAAGRNLAGEPRDHVVFEDVRLEPGCLAPVNSEVSSENLYLRGAMATAALIGGAAQRVLDLTIDYTNTRQQFGRPIGRFQAVARHLVRVAEHTHSARMAVATTFANASSALSTFDVAAAKIIAGEAAVAAARAAHQAHGAIGMTKEYELGQLTRRLWAWRGEFGSDRQWALRLGAELTPSGPDALWPRLATGRTGDLS